MNRRLAVGVFVAAALAQLIPIWSVHYLPTTDGPSHLYNAWVLRSLVRGDQPQLAQVFAIDWRPHPNWIETAFMAALMSIVPPLVAEKVFVSLIVLLFALAMWQYASSPAAAMFGLLFTFNALLMMGFYNHFLGVAIYFIAVALWWRRRERVWLLAMLLVVCYFASPMMILLAIGSIALLWIVTSRRPRELVAIVAVLPLVAWYLHVSAGQPFGERHSLSKLVSYLLRARVLYTFDHAQTAIGMLLLIVMLLSLRTRNVFALLTAAMLVLYFVAPESVGSALYIRDRIALMVFLTALAWIRLPKHTQWVLAVIVVANVVYLTIRFHQSAALVEKAVRSVNAPPRSTIRTFARDKPLVLWHAADYAAIERELVDLDNYEAATGYFPICIRRKRPI